MTDALAAAPYEVLTDDELEELAALLGPLASRLTAVGSNSENLG